MNRSNKFLKVTGILMIIFCSLAIIIGIYAFAQLKSYRVREENARIQLEWDENKGSYVPDLSFIPDSHTDTAKFTTLNQLILQLSAAFLYAAIGLITGIFGVANSAKPEKARSCVILGILSFAFMIISEFLTVIITDDFNIVRLAASVALHSLYLKGAFQNKKLLLESDWTNGKN